MLVKTFTGYSTNGLDLAVKDAEKDLDGFLDLHLGYEPQQASTTSQVSLTEDSTQYWFTLTVVFKGAAS